MLSLTKLKQKLNAVSAKAEAWINKLPDEQFTLMIILGYRVFFIGFAAGAALF